MNWRLEARCNGASPERFYVATGRLGASQARRAIEEFCLRCPVRLKCLEVGMAERWGIWGGKTPMERRAIRNAADSTHSIRLFRPSTGHSEQTGVHT